MNWTQKQKQKKQGISVGKNDYKKIETEVDNYINKKVNDSGNIGLSVAFASTYIELERRGWSAEQICELFETSKSTLELFFTQQVTFDELMNKCRGFGLSTDEIKAENIRLNALELLDYIKDYEELKNMTKAEKEIAKKKVFEMLDKGEKDDSKMLVSAGIAQNALNQFKSDWRKMNKLADEIFGKDEELSETKQKEVFIVPTVESEPVAEQVADIEPVAEVKREVKPKCKLKRTVTYQSDLAGYKEVDGKIEITLGEQVFMLSLRESMQLREELNVIENDIFIGA